MLVLSRQRDETIMIGDEIEVSVVDIRGDKVRLGITAPTRIAVHRKEVYDSIMRENAQASKVAGGDIASIAQTVKPGPGRNPRRSKTSGLTAGTTGPVVTTNAEPKPVATGQRPPDADGRTRSTA